MASIDNDSEPDPYGAEGGPGLGRIAATAAWRTGGWALRGWLGLSKRLAQAAVSPPAALELARDAHHSAQQVLLEVIELTEAKHEGAPTSKAQPVAPQAGGSPASPGAGSGAPAEPRSRTAADHAQAQTRNGTPAANPLRAGGEELLRRSRDVHWEVDAHPAYERILAELTPDEARVLRLLALDGPQPAVDVRTGGPLGVLHSRLIAPGISMIGARAGCRYLDRVPSYLNNLFRLGLVWFSRETLRDHQRYQVLEAQPEVLHAVHSVPYAKIVRRSIHLTPFGEDFCRVCLVDDEPSARPLPAHSIPPQQSPAGQRPEETAA